MKLLLLFLISYTTCAKLTQESRHENVRDPEVTQTYKGHKVLKIIPKHEGEVKILKDVIQEGNNTIKVWKGPSSPMEEVDLHIHPSAFDHVIKRLKRSSIDHRLTHVDLGRSIYYERQGYHSRTAGPSNFNISIYHTYEEIMDWLEYSAQRCGSLCSLINIGVSYERRPLKVIRIGNPSNRKPGIWIDAGLHAREWIAPATAVYIINRLISDKDDDYVVQYLLREFTWYILPLANPDGYEYTWTTDRLWRKTRSRNPMTPCRGADMNRNWDFYWAGPGTSNDACSENFHGTEPFSEAETAAMASYIWSIKDKLDFYISLHSYGQYWLTPWGYTYSYPEDYKDLVDLASMATSAMKEKSGSRYRVGTSSRMLYLASGGSDDWAKGVAGIKYSFTVELRDTGEYGFVLPAKYIKSTGKDMFNAIRTVALETTAKIMKQRKRSARRRRRKRKFF